MSRQSQVDNAKHGATQTKAMHSYQVANPRNGPFGNWDAPAQQLVAEESQDNDEVGTALGTEHRPAPK